VSKVLRLGVIGLGNIGQQHIKHILDGAVGRCAITALASRQISPLAAQIGARHYQNYQALIDSGDCDAVLVATPTMSHLDIGRSALGAGLHVLMEKPIGLSVAEGEELLALQQPGQVFALMLNQRTAPVFVRMKEHMVAGTLGALQRTHWTMTNWFRPQVYFQVSDWRATWRGEGGGLLVNQCIHNLDIFTWLCGMPTRVNGFCGFGKYHDIEVEDEATAFFHYAGGATGTFVGSTGEAPGVNRLEIVGDRGMLSYDGERLTLHRNEPGTTEYNRNTLEVFGQPETTVADITPAEQVNQHALVIDNFVRAVLDGGALIAPAREGLDSLAIANAILWSAWEGAPVELPLDVAGYQRALEQRIRLSSLRQKSDIKATVDMEKSYR
jgi:predicted dehydrogenase